jgi:hypothetical protein
MNEKIGEAFGIEHIPHKYDLSSDCLPLTITDGDVEGSPTLRISCLTHICSMQGSFQKYT